MNDAMITREEGVLQALRLEKIENRIRDNLNQYAECVIDIGRCLNQAKDEKLVPHGQWETWVKNNTGMGIHTAQRLMRAAREISEGSQLEKLSFSKAYALLALPADERESFAEEVDAENLSVRALQAAVKAQLAAEQARDEAIREMNEEAKKRIAFEKENSDMKKALENPFEIQKVRDKLNEMKNDYEALEEDVVRLSKDKKDAEENYLALKTNVERDKGAVYTSGLLSVADLQREAANFTGQLNVFLHMRSELATCSNKTRAEYRALIDSVISMCGQAIETLDRTAEVIEYE